jgi:hypothetical protein
MSGAKKALLTVLHVRSSVNRSRDMTYEGYMLVLFGAVIVIQQLIIYLMYVRIRQLLQEVDTIAGRMKLTDTELENLICRVEEFKRSKI